METRRATNMEIVGIARMAYHLAEAYIKTIGLIDSKRSDWTWDRSGTAKVDATKAVTVIEQNLLAGKPLIEGVPERLFLGGPYFEDGDHRRFNDVMNTYEVRPMSDFPKMEKAHRVFCETVASLLRVELGLP